MFGRGKTTDGTATEAAARDAAATKVGGKGRPTPKRSTAERGRRRAIAAPATRKEAYKAMRVKSREERQHQMSALRLGDERNLPPRDRGPLRRYARDLVDARRSVAEFFLPLAVLILVLSVVPNNQAKAFGSTLWLALVILIIMDSVLLVLRLRRGVAKTFPDQNGKGLTAYTLMRSMQFRRFRLPPPRVKPSRRR